MADSFNKKDREKKRRKKNLEKAERKQQRKLEGKKEVAFVYVDENGNFTDTPPDPNKKSKIKAEDIQVSVPKKEEAEPLDPIREGTVKFFNTEKGYGFITDNETKESIFVHVANLKDEIRDNDKVKFEIGTGPKGLIALDVKLI